MGEQDDIEKGMEEAVRMGWVKKCKGDKFSLTPKGKKYVENKYPVTMKRNQLGKMGIAEFMESAENEQTTEIQEGLQEAVEAGMLVKIITNGQIGWIDSHSRKPKGAIVLAGKFK